MKKSLLFITVLLTCLNISSCDVYFDDDNSKDETSDKTESIVTEILATESKTEPTTDTADSELPKIGSAEKITLSGNSDDEFTADVDCYTENDNAVLYIQKGITVKSDLLETINKIMNDLCETSGLTFQNTGYQSDYSHCAIDFYFEPDTFAGVNSDNSKINVIVASLGDGIPWADYNNIVLDQIDLEDSLDVIYHELSHVIHLVNGVDLNSMIDEGFAVYTANKALLDHNMPSLNAEQYYFVYGDDFDDSLIFDSDESFKCTFTAEDGTGYHINYHYGFRFVTFLYETYGENIFKDLLSKATECGYDSTYGNDYEAEINEDTEQLLKIVKSVTSEDVMSEFAHWYTDNWETQCQQYLQKTEANS